MKSVSGTIPTAGFTRLKMFLGSAAIFASMAVAGQAAGLYPETIPQGQSGDVMRPVATASMNGCTQLETAARMSADECGTLTLSEVVIRMNVLQGNDHDE
jgi:hypothetical protein